ncbi:MAG: hypothetical protein A2033_09520 [Bacteroidetes bacterium GWA2_31_9]|nr:MAG: hypothetical protein A2033_09520 [Bacteroidetes bacterium GWA2_31_9]
MKTINKLNYKIALTLIVFFNTLILVAQDYSFQNTINKSFLAKGDVTLEISNKYGTIHFYNTEGDSVKIRIDLTIKAKDEVKLEKMKSEINFDFNSTMSFIIAKTLIGTKSNNISTKIKYEMMPLTDNSVEINYSVYAPKNLNLKIDNKFGDMYLENHEGKITINQAYGDLKANNLSGNVNLDISFGDAVINTLSNANVAVMYSDFHLVQASSLTIESKSSNITIDQINKLTISSKRDNYIISELNYLYGETWFTDLKISSLKSECLLTLKYGGLNISNISKEFNMINLSSKYTDYKLFFNKDASCNFDITHRNADIKYPIESVNIQQNSVGADSKTLITSGFLGKKDSTSKLKVNIEYGDLKIIQN